MSRALRVASYNVHGCRGCDGRRDVGRIVRILREIDADVVGLQEVESRHGRSDIDQAEEFAAALGMTCIEGPLLHHAQRGWYGNALLTRLEVSAVRRVVFDSHGGEARGAIVCDLRAHDGVCWRVMTTHLDLHSRHRRRQFETLLDGLVPATGPATVLMGDFNEWWPWSRALAALRRHAELPPTPRTFPSWLPVLPLDRIALSACRLQGGIRRHLTPLSRRASDHLPIVADLIAEPVAAVATGGEVRAPAATADAP
ncbi:MAG TPA: endonuclease/exonuclease/phosphatase family protein [Geminicoccaceae bacterium]|nr:endonuclease/exonuclease/phosphatase family protein [Geminicoccaceae bacterium]